MLKLVYDIKCGFKELYVVEKSMEEDLGSWIQNSNDFMIDIIEEIRETDPDYNPEPLTEEDLYENYKDCPEKLLEDIFDGMYDIIREATVLEYAKTYFKHICFKDRENPFVPGVFEMTNLKLVLEDEPLKKAIANRDAPLKASEVMSILNISRPTLCHYVKKGLITIDSNYTGKQYRYNKDSVLALIKK